MSALVTVFKNNVLKFQDGTMGAVNGMRPNGQVSPVLVNTVTVMWKSYNHCSMNIAEMMLLKRMFAVHGILRTTISGLRIRGEQCLPFLLSAKTVRL